MFSKSKRTTPAKITAAALAGTSLTVAALVATNVIAVPSWAQLDGVDVASHQHSGGAAIDWQQLANNGQKFAFVKATEGTSYTNPYFSTDSQKAKEAGIMPGSYHYAKPGNRDPRGEARFYAATLATGPQPSLPPVLDLEETGGLGTEELKQYVRDWTDEIQKQTGRKPIIYTYYSFWKGQMGNTTEFSEFPLWLAYYDEQPPTDIPGGWDQMTFWQYTGSGRLDGVITDVDMNTYYGDDASLQALAADLPATTTAGAIAESLKPIKNAVGDEAKVANTIEHVTGVDVPLTTDFLMLVLGVAGGRLPVETLLTQGAAQLEQQGVFGGESEGDVSGSVSDAAGLVADGEGVSGSVGSAQQVLRAVQAIANALNEYNQSGQQLPIDMLLNLAKGASSGAGENGFSAMQLLNLLHKFGGTQDWAGKLENNEVEPNQLAYLNLAKALLAANPTEQGRVAAGGIDLPELLRPFISSAAENGQLPREAAQLMNGSAALSSDSDAASAEPAEATPAAPKASEAPVEPAAPAAGAAAPAGLPY